MSTEIRFESDPSGGPALAVDNWPLTGQAAMTGTAAQIVPNRNRSHVTIKNLGADDVYIGNESVTSSTGFPLEAGEGITIEANRAIWGVCAGGETATVSYLEDP